MGGEIIMDLKVPKEWEGQTEVLPQRLEMWVGEKGDSPFFYYGEEDKTLTFKEFNALANQIANNLISLGVQKGDRVCLLLTNPYVSTLSMFGIWKCGAIFAPINFNYAARQIAFQVKDTKPAFLIAGVNFSAIINQIQDELKEVKTIIYRPKPGDHDYDQAAENSEVNFTTLDYESLLTGNDQNPNVELYPYDIANIIYTSGTTGLPKGVVHSYRWINNYTYNRRMPLNDEDVIYTDLPMYHIAGAHSEVGSAAWVGCQIAVWDKFSPTQFWDRIRKCGATTAILLDVMVPWLMSAPESPDDRRNSLNKVPMVPMVGNHRQVAKRFGFDLIISGYSSTEAGSALTGVIDEELDEGEGTPADLWKGMSKEELRRVYESNNIQYVSGKSELAKKGWIGIPSNYHRARIVDEHGMEVPQGVVGEILLQPKLEHWMLEEYFGRPEATVKAIRDFWYHSGDAVYQDVSGHYIFVDRIGSVIRRRGENISPMQIEEAVNAMPEVVMSAAFPVPAEEGDEDEVALAVVPQEGVVLDEAEFRAALAKELPRFMIPKYIEFRDSLPMTGSNKVEKYKLRQEVIDVKGLKEKSGVRR
jgi:crotonobetaine/carnitine-CoA ligase